MHLYIPLKLAAATLLGVILSAANISVEAASLKFSRQLIPGGLWSRVPAAFPVAPAGVKAPPPKPVKPKTMKGADIVPGGSGTSYEAPSEYGIFLAKGKELKQNFDDRQITDPDNDHNYAMDITNYDKYDVSTLKVPDLEPLGTLQKAPGAPDIAWDAKSSWHKYEITGKYQSNPAAVFYHSPNQNTAVVSEIFNDRLGVDYGPTFPKIPWSEILFQTYAREAGAKTSELKYLAYANMITDDVRKIIDKARALKDLEAHKAGHWISFAKNADSRADRDAFSTLVGLDTTRIGFNMTIDHKIGLNEKSPGIVHTYSESETGGSAKHIVIELQ